MKKITKLIVLGVTIVLLPTTGLYADLEEITVTARKRDETLLEIPVSVSALSQADIVNRGIIDSESLSQFTPGFDLQNLGQGGTSGRENPGIRFRGVAVQQASPASRSGAIFWNGAYVSDGIGVLPLIDLERAEVIKGPQNAVFGRNTFAGAVNYIPAKPTEELSGRVALSYTPDDDDSHEITAAFGGQISDRFGGRVAVTDTTKGGYYEFEDGAPLGREETTAVMGSLVFDVTDNVSVSYSGFYVDSEDTRVLVSQAGPVGPGECNRTFNGNFRNVADGSNAGSFSTDLSQNTGNIFCGSIPDWDDLPPDAPSFSSPDANTPNVPFGGGWEYVNTAPIELAGEDIEAPDGIGNAYEVVRHHLSTDIELDNGFSINAFYSIGESQHWGINDSTFGAGPAGSPGWWTGFIKDVEDTSAEIRLTSPSDRRLRYSIGLSHYNQDTIQGDFNQFAGFAQNILMIPGAGITPAGIQTGEGTNNGVFGSIDYDINDAWTVSFEGRWNDDEQDIVFEGTSGTEGNAATGRSQSFSAFMPRAIISWQPAGNLNLYASYSESLLQGIATQAEGYAAAVPEAGLNADTVGFFTPRQELQAFEVGIKHELNECFNYTASLYAMDWDNQTFFELSPQFVPLNLSGDSEYLGLDIEFNALVTDWFQLVGGFSWVDVELNDFAGAGSVATSVLAPDLVAGTQIDSSGNRPRYIPETSGSLSALFNVGDIGGMAASLRLDFIHTGSFFVDNFEWNEVDSALKLNVRATLDVTDNITVELFGQNVTDDRTWTTAGGTTGAGGPNRQTFSVPVRGDEYGIRLTAGF